MDRAVPEGDSQEQANVRYWVGDHVGHYARHDLRKVEAVILDRYGEAFDGRVLEVGCGAGRVTGHLITVAAEVHGIDISASMIDHCRRAYPQGTFRVADLRDLGEYDDGFFDAIFASFNVIDYISPAERGAALDSWRRVLGADGMLVMSSHNRGSPLPRAYAGAPGDSELSVGRPPANCGQHRAAPTLGPQQGAAAALRAPRGRPRSGHRLRRRLPHPVLLHLARRSGRQLAAHGFDLLECLARDGSAGRAG